MQLYGSTTSPYVRRLRMWLSNDAFEFINLDIFSKEGHHTLLKNNPTMKIPMLKDGPWTIYDSRQIHRYLNDKFNRESLNWHDENNMTVIDAANDSLVELLLLSRSGLPMDSDVMFIQRQQQRVANTLEVLNQKVAEGEFEQWNYVAICLFCLLDWIDFRQLHDLSSYDALNAFAEQHKQRPEAIATDPRD